MLTILVANYSADFPRQGESPNSGWQYQWNAPIGSDTSTNSLTDPLSEFTPLLFAGAHASWTADGDFDPTTDPISKHVRLDANGGHPGVGSRTGSLAQQAARFVIASYTVPESGFYEIRDSFVGLNPTDPLAASDGVEFRVFVNRAEPLAVGVVNQDARKYFDTFLGFLSSGDTVHVAFGANDHLSHDYFTTDFNIVRDSELQQVVAGFVDDFDVSRSRSSEFGWEYLWNAPNNWIAGQSPDSTQLRSAAFGEPESYRPLIDAGDDVLTADGDQDGRNGVADGFLRLTAGSGHVGAGFGTPDYRDRFAIAAFTVPHSGLYAIVKSSITVDERSDDGIELSVHVGEGNRRPDQPLVVAGGLTQSFDMGLGYLKQGDRIFVGYGANRNHIHDRFETDFEIVRRLSRPVPNLGLLEQEGAVVSVNETRFGVPGAIPDDHQDDWRAIKTALDYAHVNGAQKVTFEPGTYNVSSAGLAEPNDSLFVLTRFNDFIIDGNGSTFIIDDHTRSLFRLHGSENIILQNFTVDYAQRVPAVGSESNDLFKPLTFTQGVISDLDRTANAFTLTVNTTAFLAPDETFVQNGLTQGWGYAIDAKVDGRLKTGSDWHYPTQAVEALPDPGQFRITSVRTAGLSDGDRYAMQRRLNRSMIGIFNGSRDVSVIDVTAFTSPAVFVGAVQSDGVNVIDSQVSIRPDDWPETPGTRRWKSINGDGVHIQASREGVWVEGSTFEGLGDDVMNFYQLPMTVQNKISDRQFTVGNVVTNRMIGVPEYSVQVGDRLAFFNPLAGTVLETAEVIAVEEALVPNPDEPGGSLLKLRTITVDQPVEGVIESTRSDFASYRNETTIFNTSLSRSSLVQDSYLGNSRRYGNFLMANNVQLIDNVYEGLSDEAVAAHNEPGWPLGLFASDVLIQGNEFVNNGFSLRYLASDFHTGNVAFQAARYAPFDEQGIPVVEPDKLVEQNMHVYRNLEIRDNLFYHWRKAAISVRNSMDVTIEGNVIATKAFSNLVALPTSPIQIHNTQKVSVQRNIVHEQRIPVGETSNVDLTTGTTQFVLDHGLELWLKFDQGQVLQDSSGNGVLPEFNNAGVEPGKFDSSVIFNRTNSVTVSNLPAGTVSNQTVSLWFNPIGQRPGEKQVIFEQGDPGNGLSLYLDDDKLYVAAWSDGNFANFLYSTTDLSGWQHVALVLDNNSHRLRGYLNGRKFSTGSAGLIEMSSSNVTLGGVGVGGTRLHSGSVGHGQNGFSGKIDELRIYSRVLGDGEVAGLATRT